MKTPVALTRGEIKVDPEFHSLWQDATKVVEAHPLWQDPFMKALEHPQASPELSRSLVLTWAQQMYHGSLAFPRYVGNLVARVKNHAAGRKLAINAAVERGYPDESRSHFLLAVDLLRSMGMSENGIVSIPVDPASRKYIDGHLDYTKNAPLAQAIGCLGLGIEALTTEEFSRLGNAYVKTSTASPRRTYKSQGYFTENIMADAQHTGEFEEIAFLTWKAKEIPGGMYGCMDNIVEGAKFSLDSRQKFFSGVYNLANQRS